MSGEYSVVPGSDSSRVLMFFHGGGYCSGLIRSHRRLVTEAGRRQKCAHLLSHIGSRQSTRFPQRTMTR
jgi:hypothetical protein